MNSLLGELRATGVLCTAITESAVNALRSRIPLDPIVHVVAVDPAGGMDTGIERAGGEGPTLALDLDVIHREVSGLAPSLEPFPVLRDHLTSEESRAWNQNSGLSAAFRRVLQDHLDALPDTGQRRRLVSFGQRRGASLVGVVLDLNAQAFAEADRASVSLDTKRVSLIRAVEEELVMTLSKDLGEAGRFRPAGSAWHAEILRNAARRLLDEFLSYESAPVLDVLTAIASLPHEGAPCTGELMWFGVGEAADARALQLSEPVRLNMQNVALLRKLLVASGPGRAAACSTIRESNGALPLSALTHLCTGLGTAPSLNVRFLRGSRWELRVDSKSLVNVVGGFVQLPPVFERERFAAACTRVFATCGTLDVDKLWDLARAVADDPTGAVLVISDRAAESTRHVRAGFPCAPSTVAPSALRDLSRIDGAVCLSPDGTVHGLGVILDGLTTGSELRERGSRFNSAVRYVKSHASERLLVLVVSSDGHVDILEPGNA